MKAQFGICWVTLDDNRYWYVLAWSVNWNWFLMTWRGWQKRWTGSWIFHSHLLQQCTPHFGALICALLQFSLCLLCLQLPWMRSLVRSAVGVASSQAPWIPFFFICSAQKLLPWQCVIITTDLGVKETGRPHLHSPPFPVSVIAVGGLATLLEVTDQCWSQLFLVDMGASVSVIPASTALIFDLLSSDCSPILHMAHIKKIPTFCHIISTLQFGEHNSDAQLLSANIQWPLLGADFLWEHRLLVDLSSNCLFFPDSWHPPLAPSQCTIPSLSALWEMKTLEKWKQCFH